MMNVVKKNKTLKTMLASVSIALFIALTCRLSHAAPVKYEIDPEHSSVSFQIRHLVSKLRGAFGTFSGTLMIDEDKPKQSTIEMSVDVPSIDTKSKKRDAHLLSPEFFDSAKFPTMTISNARVTSGRRLRKKRGGRFHLDADLTIKDVTKRVRFEAEYLGSATDPWKNEFASFSAKTTINRKEFGLKWNKVVESGTLLVGERVQIEVNIAAKKVKPGTESTAPAKTDVKTDASPSTTQQPGSATSTAASTTTATAPASTATSTPPSAVVKTAPAAAADVAKNAVKSGVQAVEKKVKAITP